MNLDALRSGIWSDEEDDADKNVVDDKHDILNDMPLPKVLTTRFVNFSKPYLRRLSFRDFPMLEYSFMATLQDLFDTHVAQVQDRTFLGSDHPTLRKLMMGCIFIAFRICHLPFTAKDLFFTNLRMLSTKPERFCRNINRKMKTKVPQEGKSEESRRRFIRRLVRYYLHEKDDPTLFDTIYLEVEKVRKKLKNLRFTQQLLIATQLLYMKKKSDCMLPHSARVLFYFDDMFVSKNNLERYCKQCLTR